MRSLSFQHLSLDEDIPAFADVDAAGEVVSFLTAYDQPKISFATQWGIGVTLFRRYSIGYMRYNLGKRSLTGTRMLSNPHFLYDDGSEAPSDGLTAVPSLVEFNLGNLRSRYHVVRFGITF